MNIHELNDRIKPYLVSPDELPEDGAKVRVRPEPHRPKVYGQGAPLKGPQLNGRQFTWGQPLKVDASCDPEHSVGDPEAGCVRPMAVQESPNLFMTEKNYQKYITENTDEQV